MVNRMVSALGAGAAKVAVRRMAVVSPFSRMEECVEVMLATRTVAGGAVPISKVRLRTAVLTGSGRAVDDRVDDGGVACRQRCARERPGFCVEYQTGW